MNLIRKAGAGLTALCLAAPLTANATPFWWKTAPHPDMPGLSSSSLTTFRSLEYEPIVSDLGAEIPNDIE